MLPKHCCSAHSLIPGYTSEDLSSASSSSHQSYSTSHQKSQGSSTFSSSSSSSSDSIGSQDCIALRQPSAYIIDLSAQGDVEEDCDDSDLKKDSQSVLSSSNSANYSTSVGVEEPLLSTSPSSPQYLLQTLSPSLSIALQTMQPTLLHFCNYIRKLFESNGPTCIPGFNRQQFLQMASRQPPTFPNFCERVQRSLYWPVLFLVCRPDVSPIFQNGEVNHRYVGPLLALYCILHNCDWLLSLTPPNVVEMLRFENSKLMQHLEGTKRKEGRGDLMDAEEKNRLLAVKKITMKSIETVVAMVKIFMSAVEILQWTEAERVLRPSLDSIAIPSSALSSAAKIPTSASSPSSTTPSSPSSALSTVTVQSSHSSSHHHHNPHPHADPAPLSHSHHPAPDSKSASSLSARTSSAHYYDHGGLSESRKTETRSRANSRALVVMAMERSIFERVLLRPYLEDLEAKPDKVSAGMAEGDEREQDGIVAEGSVIPLVGSGNIDEKRIALSDWVAIGYVSQAYSVWLRPLLRKELVASLGTMSMKRLTSSSHLEISMYLLPDIMKVGHGSQALYLYIVF